MAKYFRLFLSILLLSCVVVETVPSQASFTGELELSYSGSTVPTCDNSDSDSFGILPNFAKLNFALTHKTQLPDLYTFSHKLTYQRPSIRSPPAISFTT
ncbi:hypothetical protein ACMZOO_15600 [Catenovulum sp. SX2]|uniref:hypothetical protein n=1 Tax=Catenovulum sp. SX2 TaxID=3398614 RepID=UPI003F84C4A3